MDVRYPQEGLKGEGRVPKVETVIDKIHDSAKKNGRDVVAMERTMNILPYVTTASKEELLQHAKISKSVGLLAFDDYMTNMPNGSDANIFAQTFKKGADGLPSNYPGVKIINCSGGGFRNAIHGKNEYMSFDQIKASCAYHLETMYRRCISKEPFVASGMRHAA